MTDPATEPSDADRASVAGWITRSRRVADDAIRNGDPATALYHNGVADLLELADTATAVRFVREAALRTLAGAPGLTLPDAPPIRESERWLATWWLTRRTRLARERLNRERARVGLPPVVRNVMAVADDWD